MLRLGGNTDRQRERIVAAFEKQKSTAEIADYLKSLFHGGNGIGSVTAWYSEDGIHLSHGKSARYDKSAQVISWESAAERIGQLLQEGQFATNVELAESAGYERSLLAEKLWYLYHDFSKEARESGYLASLSGIPGSGFQEGTEWLSSQLNKPEFRQTLAEEYAAFWTAYQQDRDLLRFHYHKPREIWENLKDLSLPRTAESSGLAEAPAVKQFITEDEIDAAMTGGSGVEGGKGRIFAFFQNPHTDKEKVAFLKNEYGMGGRSDALSNARGSWVDYDGKGIRYRKDGCPDVLLSWEKVSKRITSLIQKGRYLTDKEQAEYDKIQAEKAIDAQEAEFGVDGTRVFRDTETEPEKPTLRELHEQYKPVVIAAVLEDVPYRNACGHSDHENAVIEGNAAIRRAVLGSGNMELLRLYSDVPEFRQRLHREVIDETYPRLHEQLRPLSQDDIDDAIRAWNGDLQSKHAVVRYMEAHAREKDTAAWLARTFDGGDGKTPFAVRPDSPEGTALPWPKVQRRLAQLIQDDRFYTEEEQDRFDNIDPIAIRESLEERGIVSGQVADPEKLDNDPFIQQVTADAERIASNSEPEIYTSKGGHSYQPGDAIDATTDSKGTVVRMVIDHVDEDYIWYTMPRVPDQEPVQMRREIFEKYLDSGEFQPVSAPDLSVQPIAREGDTITIGGKPAREISVTISDEEYAEVRGFVRQRTSYDPTDPVYSVRDTVYLDDRDYQITELREDTVQLLPTGMSYPIYRTENRERFEQLLWADNRNSFYTEFLPVNPDTADQDLRDVLTHGLIRAQEKAELSELLRTGRTNSEVALWLSRAYPDIIETMELETGDTADYRTMPEGIELEVLDEDEKRLAMLFFRWDEVAPLLRGLYDRQLDGFVQEQDEPYMEAPADEEESVETVTPDEKPTPEAPAFHAETEAVYLGDKNGLPYDIVVERLRMDEPEPTPPEPEPSAEQAPLEEHKADIRRSAENFHITDDHLGESGPKAKFWRNIKAIAILKQVEQENRYATVEEQHIISQYVGWGGLADAFDSGKPEWALEYSELKSVLTEEEYASARSSTLNAHPARTGTLCGAGSA